MDIADPTFLADFEQFKIAPSEFDHKAHLKLCFLCIKKYGLEDALDKIPSLIRRYVAHVGASDKYHHTLTITAIHIVHQRMADRGEIFEFFLKRNLDLLQNFVGIIAEYYSDNIIHSNQARKEFVKPDLRKLC